MVIRPNYSRYKQQLKFEKKDISQLKQHAKINESMKNYGVTKKVFFVLGVGSFVMVAGPYIWLNFFKKVPHEELVKKEKISRKKDKSEGEFLMKHKIECGILGQK